MSLDRIQVVCNFTNFIAVAQALSGTPTTPYAAATAGQKAILDTIGRVGCLDIVIPATQSVTITDAAGVSYTVVNGSATAPLVYRVPIINGQTKVLLRGSGTVTVVVLAD